MSFMKKILVVFAALLIPAQAFAGSDVMYRCGNPPIPGPCMYCNKSGCYAQYQPGTRCGNETRVCMSDTPFEMLTPEIMEPMEEFKVSIINLLGKTNDELFARLATSLATAETAKAKAEAGSQTQNAAPPVIAEGYIESVNKLDGIAFPCGNLAGYALNKSMSIIDQMNSFLAADDRDYAYSLTVNARWNSDDAATLIESIKDNDSLDPISGTFSKQEAMTLLNAYQAAFQIPVIGNLPENAKGQGVDTYLAGIGRVAFTRQMMGESFRRYVLMRTGMIPYSIAKDFLTGWFLYAKKNANQETVADTGQSSGSTMVAEKEISPAKKNILPVLHALRTQTGGLATNAAFSDDINEPFVSYATYDPDSGFPEITKTSSTGTTTSTSGSIDWGKLLSTDMPYLRRDGSAGRNLLNCCGEVKTDKNGNVIPGQQSGVINEEILNRTRTNAPIWRIVQEVANELGLDPKIIGTIVGIESYGGRKGMERENPKDALGAMQLRRITARDGWGGHVLRVTPGTKKENPDLSPDDERLDPRKNITKGAAYYKHIRDEFYTGKNGASNTGDIGAFGGYNWSPAGATWWIKNGQYRSGKNIVTTLPDQTYCYTCLGFKYPYAALRELYSSGKPEYVPIPKTNSIPETVLQAPEEREVTRGDPMERKSGEEDTLGTSQEDAGPVTEADMEKIKKSGDYTMVDVSVPTIGSSGLPSRKLSLTPHEITQEDLNRMNELIPGTGDDELISRNTLFEMMLDMYNSEVYQNTMVAVPEEVVAAEVMKLKSVMVQLYNDTRKAAEQNSILWSMVLALASQDAMMDELRSFNSNFKTVSFRQE